MNIHVNISTSMQHGIYFTPVVPNTCVLGNRVNRGQTPRPKVLEKNIRLIYCLDKFGYRIRLSTMLYYLSNNIVNFHFNRQLMGEILVKLENCLAKLLQNMPATLRPSWFKAALILLAIQL